MDEFECPGGEPCPDSNNNGIPDWREYFCHSGIVVPQAMVQNDVITVCEGEPVVLSGQNGADIQGNVSYVWTGPDGFFVNGVGAEDALYEASLQTVTEAQTGTYILQLFTEFGCPSEPISVQVMISEKPQTPQISVLDDKLCGGELIELNSTLYTVNAIIYNWFLNNGNGTELVASTDVPTLFLDSVNETNTGDYSVMVVVDGCASEESNLQDIQIQSPTPIVVENSTSSATPGCENESVELSAPIFIDATYEWIGPNGFTSNLPNPVIGALTAETAGEYYAIIRTEFCDIISERTTVYLYNEITANDDTYSLAFNQELSATNLAINDELGNVTNYLITPLSQPVHGTLTNNNGVITYRPNENYFGLDAFMYEICNADCPDICDVANVNLFVSNRLYLQNRFRFITH